MVQPDTHQRESQPPGLVSVVDLVVLGAKSCPQGKVSKVWLVPSCGRKLSGICISKCQFLNKRNTEGHQHLPIEPPGSSSTPAPADPPASLFLPSGSQSQGPQPSRQASLGSIQPPRGECNSVSPLARGGLPYHPSMLALLSCVTGDTPDSSTLSLGPGQHPLSQHTHLPRIVISLNYF